MRRFSSEKRFSVVKDGLKEIFNIRLLLFFCVKVDERINKEFYVYVHFVNKVILQTFSI